MREAEIPVFIFTGFLDAGKTTFIQGTLEDERFNNGIKTLLVVCEEGEEEYDFSAFAGDNVTKVVFEDEELLTPDRLEAARKRSGAERVMVEYNGMWNIDSLFPRFSGELGGRAGAHLRRCRDIPVLQREYAKPCVR